MRIQTTEELLQPIRKVLICLDLTDIDLSLIRYASDLSRALLIEQIIFFHGIQAYSLPDAARKDFPDVETELKDMINESIQKSVKSCFGKDARWQVVIQVIYEDAAQAVVDYSGGKEIGLTVIGQKYGKDRQANYGHKIAALADSDVLIVPQDARPSKSPIMCAVDFSDASIRAFERALDISRSLLAPLICYAISDPSHAYFPASTLRSYKSETRRSAKAFEKFLTSYGLSPDQVPCRIEVTDQVRHENEAEKIYAATLQEKAGLIVVGASGEKEKTTSLLGHLCESFRLMEKEMPVMIVQSKSRKTFP